MINPTLPPGNDPVCDLLRILSDPNLHRQRLVEIERRLADIAQREAALEAGQAKLAADRERFRMAVSMTLGE